MVDGLAVIKVKKTRLAWGLAFCVSLLDGHGGYMRFLH